MASAEQFPLFYPGDARRAFGSEDYLRRIARTSQWSGGSRVLELCAGPAGLLLAKEFGCEVLAADPDDKVLEVLRERVKAHGLGERVEVRKVDFSRMAFADSEFDGILILGRVPMPIRAAVASLRKFLAPKGRLVMTYPVKVGRYPAKMATDHWERRLGEPLLLPREALQVFEKGGFEPEGIETLADSELNDFYGDLEPNLAAQASGNPAGVAALKAEIELHRAQGGKASVSLGLVIGRRKEPGEKPPVSRDSG